MNDEQWNEFAASEREANARPIDGGLLQPPQDDAEVDAMAGVMMKADKTADSPTVFTLWHHYAEALIAAGYRKVEK